MFINHSSREVTAKIVYYGPGLSGKTTNLQYIFSVTNPRSRGELISIETEIERTLFFDLLPLNVGSINGYQTRFQLYTVPGQIFYDSTRKLVLKGADGIVFIADSQELMQQSNLESLENLKTNLANHKLDINNIPIVFQYNKRDLSLILPVENLNLLLNKSAHPFFEAVAPRGTGVLETLRGISTLVLQKIRSLLETPKNGSIEPITPPVEFSFNKKHKMIEKEDLPLRKIHTDNLESAAQQLNPASQTIPSIVDLPFEVNKEPEFELLMDPVVEINDMKDLDDIFSTQEIEEIQPLKDLEEIKIDNEDLEMMSDENLFPAEIDIEEPPVPSTVPEDISVEDSTNELRKHTPLETIEKNDESPFNLSPDDLVSIQDINPFPVEEEIPELVSRNTKQDNNDFKQISRKENDPLKELQIGLRKQEEIKTPIRTKSNDAISRLKEIEDLKKSLSSAPAIKKEKKPTENFKGLDIFDRLKDKTRVTVIKDIPINDPTLIIDVKGADLRLLDSFQVEITPETKKVTLIFDVKK